MPKIYAYVRLSKWDLGAFRLLGAGLGNLLFPWARMVVAAKIHGFPMVWPTWPQVKLGPVLRREPDRRCYAGLFQNPGDYIDGLEKCCVRALSRHIKEHIWHNSYENMINQKTSLLIFSGIEGKFSPIIGYRQLVKQELIRITRPQHLIGFSHDFTRSITVHVRLGDFQPFDDTKMRLGSFNIRLPLWWVIDTVHRLRCDLGGEYPVHVFSDGSDKDLHNLLVLPNVKRLHFGSALADMLAMSRSRVIIASSTFSSWSAYLGTVPSIYYPGQLRQRLIQGCTECEIEREPGKQFDKAFLDIVTQNMEKAT